MPTDCAKPIKLQDNSEYRVQGTYLYTDQEGAILLYITTGRIADETDFLTDDYYPEYAEETYESSFWEYIETRLASKLVLRLTGETTLYQLLFSESQLIEQKAQKISRAQAQSKPKGNKYWAEQIGQKMVITNFASGELSKNLFGRVDVPQYYSGASKLVNFDIIPTGGIQRRKGTKRIGKLSGNSRLIPFIVNKDISFILEFAPGIINIWNSEGKILYDNNNQLGFNSTSAEFILYSTIT